MSTQSFLQNLQDQLNAFRPKDLDINTANARMEHTSTNVKSINMQTTILLIILVILITIAFITHLTN